MPKYVITASRFLNGKLVRASPDQPATIEVPDGTKVDRLMFPVDAAPTIAKLKPHFAGDAKVSIGGAPPVASEVKAPVAGTEKPKRPSDRDL